VTLSQAGDSVVARPRRGCGRAAARCRTTRFTLSHGEVHLVARRGSPCRTARLTLSHGEVHLVTRRGNVVARRGQVCDRRPAARCEERAVTTRPADALPRARSERLVRGLVVRDVPPGSRFGRGGRQTPGAGVCCLYVRSPLRPLRRSAPRMPAVRPRDARLLDRSRAAKCPPHGIDRESPINTNALSARLPDIQVLRNLISKLDRCRALGIFNEKQLVRMI
jgi:hypothetical protein